ncbi:MAG TPA: 3-hydroxyacyl-CoA dehydrogenase NAD-binding domain-containing protein, partial [Thermoanaerobaculia bacterium]|nr:3-hydroxyacyl-CoA dehydrogenase NAD-binding domain-containing protein [Thermoanaerobaculia bacterium]
MEIRTVGVVGAGQMGSGIAHVAAAAGASVVLADATSEIVARARSLIAKNLDREVAKGKRTAEDREAALSRIAETTDFAA